MPKTINELMLAALESLEISLNDWNTILTTEDLRKQSIHIAVRKLSLLYHPDRYERNREEKIIAEGLTREEGLHKFRAVIDAREFLLEHLDNKFTSPHSSNNQSSTEINSEQYRLTYQEENDEFLYQKGREKIRNRWQREESRRQENSLSFNQNQDFSTLSEIEKINSLRCYLLTGETQNIQGLTINALSALYTTSSKTCSVNLMVLSLSAAIRLNFPEYSSSLVNALRLLVGHCFHQLLSSKSSWMPDVFLACLAANELIREEYFELQDSFKIPNDDPFLMAIASSWLSDEELNKLLNAHPYNHNSPFFAPTLRREQVKALLDYGFKDCLRSFNLTSSIVSNDSIELYLDRMSKFLLNYTQLLMLHINEEERVILSTIMRLIFEKAKERISNPHYESQTWSAIAEATQEFPNKIKLMKAFLAQFPNRGFSSIKHETYSYVFSSQNSSAIIIPSNQNNNESSLNNLPPEWQMLLPLREEEQKKILICSQRLENLQEEFENIIALSKSFNQKTPVSDIVQQRKYIYEVVYPLLVSKTVREIKKIATLKMGKPYKALLEKTGPVGYSIDSYRLNNIPFSPIIKFYRASVLPSSDNETLPTLVDEAATYFPTLIHMSVVSGENLSKLILDLLETLEQFDWEDSFSKWNASHNEIVNSNNSYHAKEMLFSFDQTYLRRALSSLNIALIAISNTTNSSTVNRRCHELSKRVRKLSPFFYLDESPEKIKFNPFYTCQDYYSYKPDLHYYSEGPLSDAKKKCEQWGEYISKWPLLDDVERRIVSSWVNDEKPWRVEYNYDVHCQFNIAAAEFLMKENFSTTTKDASKMKEIIKNYWLDRLIYDKKQETCSFLIAWIGCCVQKNDRASVNNLVAFIRDTLTLEYNAISVNRGLQQIDAQILKISYFNRFGLEWGEWIYHKISQLSVSSTAEIENSPCPEYLFIVRTEDSPYKKVVLAAIQQYQQPSKPGVIGAMLHVKNHISGNRDANKLKQFINMTPGITDPMLRNLVEVIILFRKNISEATKNIFEPLLVDTSASSGVSESNRPRI